jgi:hypothetical protein
MQSLARRAVGVWYSAEAGEDVGKCRGEKEEAFRKL